MDKNLKEIITEGDEDSARIVIDNIRTRYSCRIFSGKPVSREVVETLLEAANCAPSPMNTQPWEFFVLTGEPLQKYREAVDNWLKSAEKRGEQTAILPEGNFLSTLPKNLVERKRKHLKSLSRKLERVGVALKDVYRWTYYCHYAPVVIMVIADAVKRDKHGLEIHQALAAAVQNILLAAHSLGYGTCWIGDIMRFGTELHEHLGLSGMKEVVAAVALGYPETDMGVQLERVPKEPLGKNVQWMGFK